MQPDGHCEAKESGRQRRPSNPAAERHRDDPSAADRAEPGVLSVPNAGGNQRIHQDILGADLQVGGRIAHG